MALKSAYELAMEKSETIVKDEDLLKLSEEQKKTINDIKMKYETKIAEEEIMAREKVNQLEAEERSLHQREIDLQINGMKQKYREKMNEEIQGLKDEWRAL